MLVKILNIFINPQLVDRVKPRRSVNEIIVLVEYEHILLIRKSSSPHTIDIAVISK